MLRQTIKLIEELKSQYKQVSFEKFLESLVLNSD